MCNGAGQIPDDRAASVPAAVGASEVSRQLLVTTIAKYYEGRVSDADIGKLQVAWRGFAKNASKVNAQLRHFERSHADAVHGLAWWEERAQSAAAHPEHAVSAIERVNMWLCADPTVPVKLTPRPHRPAWIQGTWKCAAVDRHHTKGTVRREPLDLARHCRS